MKGWRDWSVKVRATAVIGSLIAAWLVVTPIAQALMPPDVELEWAGAGVGATGTIRNLTGETLDGLAMETYLNESASILGFQAGFERVTYHALFDTVSKQEQFEWLAQTTPGGYGDAHHIHRAGDPPLKELFAAPPARLGPHSQASFSVHKSADTFPPSVQVYANGRSLRVRQVLRQVLH